MKILLSSFLLFSLIQGVVAQQWMGLQDVLSVGLENNFSIQIAENRRTIARNNLTPGNAGYLPSLDLRGQFSGSLNNTNRSLLDGGQAEPLRSIHNTLGSASLNLGWTLFDGFRVRTNHKRLTALTEMSDLNTRFAVEQLIASLAAEYYNLVHQKRLLANQRYALDLSRERVRIDQERFLLGSGSRLQLLQAEVFLNADSSRVGRQEEQVRASRIRLRELMAAGDLKLPLEPVDSVIELRDILILETLLAAMEQNNTLLGLVEKNITLAEYDGQVVASRAYPYVQLNSGYGYSHNTYQSGSFSNQQTRGMNYGITVGINLFDGLNQRRQMQNAIIEQENARLEYAEVLRGLEADLLTTYNAYLNYLRLLDLETQNLEVAYETLDIAMERYRLGALSGLELREAQQSLLEAEERKLSILFQAKLAEIGLLRLAGNIDRYL